MKQNSHSQNIDYSIEWLTKEIIKTDFEQKHTGKIQYLKIRKVDLLKLVLKFVKLIKEGY